MFAPIRDLTREYREASDALKAATAAAFQEGVDVPLNDRASGFIDDVADGYRMSMEQAMKDSVPSPKIRNWLGGVDEEASPTIDQVFQDADEWQANELDVGDSVSVVAEDEDTRVRIDKLNQIRSQ